MLFFLRIETVSNPIVLPDKMPSSAVGELSRILEAATSGLAAGSEIRLDASGVRTVGALAAEMLLRFARGVEAGGSRMAIEPSADFEDDLRILGLRNMLLRKDPAT